MKRLYQITNSLQPEIEEISGIKVLAQLSQIPSTEGGVIYPKTQFQTRSRTGKRRISIRQTE